MFFINARQIPGVNRIKDLGLSGQCWKFEKDFGEMHNKWQLGTEEGGEKDDEAGVTVTSP